MVLKTEQLIRKLYITDRKTRSSSKNLFILEKVYTKKNYFSFEKKFEKFCYALKIHFSMLIKYLLEVSIIDNVPVKPLHLFGHSVVGIYLLFYSKFVLMFFFFVFFSKSKSLNTFFTILDHNHKQTLF